MSVKKSSKSKSDESKTKKSSKSSSKSETKKLTKKKEKSYGVFKEEYKGNDIIAIREIDSDGEPVGDFPVVSMGKRKWELALQFSSEVEKLLAELE